ncbi:XrtA/PEP-CTERM system histidine kinase PrsK [Rhizomicrobium electricum]|uniref:histidine kinase n=1 Tax=Rhizomicrobium electricum TaxID=480070 RepID=A0ABN1EP28_9PROT|nr:XrtA/PEP-CTERM system histidine kinase PrsK [Rhizomicrobium electricum]NIJ46895.1 putative PEP-CTERM system histidine kinase [Rhizomicrobium electricum]
MGLGISLFAGLVAALAYSAFAAILPAWGKRSRLNMTFAFASAATALWALAGAFDDAGWVEPWTVRCAAALREGAWFTLLIAILRQDAVHHPLWRRLAIAAAALAAANFVFAATSATIDTGLGVRLNQPLIAFAVAVMGLILAENLARNVVNARLWSAKLMLIALTALYVYHILEYIPEILASQTPEAFAVAEPLLYLLALPLFVVTAVRSDSLRLKVHSSRRVVFHSATLIVTGVVLQGIAAAALYVRHFGGTPAVVLTIVLGFGSLVALIVALSTASVRSQIRTFINENFYSYKYDYRLEWTKFNQALSRYEDRGGPERVLLTLSDLLDSPGGVLFVRRSGWKQYARLAYSQFGETLGPIQETDPVLASLADERIAFLELRDDDTLWKPRAPETWLVVPLRFRNELIGFSLLHKPRAPKKLDWEDRNLVALIASQLAGYLVHEQTAQALADSQQLAEFNNRVTFALHDLKNTAGQLSLLVQNAEKFGDNAAFRADMMETIRHAVDNLQGLIGKLRDGSKPAQPAAPARVNVADIVARFALKKAAAGVVFARDRGETLAFADIAQPAAFENALEHIVTNAIEASPEPGSVELSVAAASGRIRVAVRDRGPGMSADFIARELFRPLRTTKNKGLGIGAYQARAMMRDLGGDIEVESTVGSGTTVTLVLPGEDVKLKEAS